jgi:hypothetical protein
MNELKDYLTKEQLDKLPKYARDAYEYMKRDRAMWHQEAMRESVPGSNVIVDKGVREEFGLPKNSRVRFRMGPGPQDYIDVSHGSGAWPGDRTEILSIRAGKSLLQVLPEACNCVSVQLAGLG